MPKYLITADDIEKKKNAFYKKRTTNHWPCKTELVSEIPCSFGNELSDVLEPLEPKLNDLGLSLSGF